MSPAPARGTRRVVAGLALVLAVLAGTASLAPPSAGYPIDRPPHCTTDGKALFTCLGYQSFFRRNPTPAEVAYWAPQMPARKTFFLATLARAEESRAQGVRGYYRELVLREPTRAELAYWTDHLLDPGAQRRLQAELIGSDTGDVQGFFNRAFGNLLGRGATDAEIAYWGARAEKTSRAKVAAEIAVTLEARRELAFRTFNSELLRFPGPSERDYWAEWYRTSTGYTDLRIALKSAAEAYPDGSGYCSVVAPAMGSACIGPSA